MPVAFLNWIESRSLRFHFALALGLGLFLRCLTAYFSYGPLAMDDYLDAVAPALQWAEGKPAPVNPGRSYLIVWLLGGIIKAGQFLGIHEQAVSQVRFGYAGLGVFSLLTLVGGYLYAKLFADKVFAALTLYLLALHAFMPLGSTRAFGEAVSMTWVMLGLGLAEWARAKHRSFIFLLAMLLLGVGTLFRYQSGLIMFAYLGWLAYERRFGLVLLGLLAGLATLGGEIAQDLYRQRAPLETFFVYLKRNEGSAAIYGVQPWYVFIFALLAATYFPFSLSLRKGIPLMLKRHGALVVCAGVFVTAHTLILHKEERFLFPIVPPFLILLAAAWTNARGEWAARRIYFPSFLVLNFGLLGLVTFSNSQASLIEPVVTAQERFDSGVFLETDTTLASSYLARNVFLREDFIFERGTTEDVDRVLTDNPKRAMVMVLAGEKTDAMVNLEHRRTRRGLCGRLESAASLTDRLIYRMNPKYNSRRKPTYFVVCRRG